VKFEEYLTESIKKICEGQPVNRALFEARVQVFLRLVAKGVEPERARRIMDIYLEGD